MQIKYQKQHGTWQKKRKLNKLMKIYLQARKYETFIESFTM